MCSLNREVLNQLVISATLSQFDDVALMNTLGGMFAFTHTIAAGLQQLVLQLWYEKPCGLAQPVSLIQTGDRIPWEVLAIQLPATKNPLFSQNLLTLSMDPKRCSNCSKDSLTELEVVSMQCCANTNERKGHKRDFFATEEEENILRNVAFSCFCCSSSWWSYTRRTCKEACKEI